MQAGPVRELATACVIVKRGLGPRRYVIVLSAKFGGCAQVRTVDPLIKSQLLYQLSYTPINARGVVAISMATRGSIAKLFRAVHPPRSISRCFSVQHDFSCERPARRPSSTCCRDV